MKQRPTIGDKLHIFRVDQTVNTDRTVPRAKQLTSASKNGTSVSYTYNVSGIRDSQTVNGTTYSYITQNGQVVRQQWGDNVLDIIYDNNGQPNEMVYNGAHYYYILNQQGDVIALAASNGSIMARYPNISFPIGKVDITLNGEITMKCKHKPKDSSWIVSTEYGRYFFFDRVQRCKKCDARINVVHKKCCIALAFVLIVIQLLLLLAWFVAWVIGLKLMFLVLFIGVRYISKLHIGDLVSWNEVVICDREPTPYMEHLN